VGNLRLLCGTHNRYEAERTFGAEFMAEKREAVKRERAEARERKKRESQQREKEQPEARQREKHQLEDQAPSSDPDRDVTPWLRELRCRPEHIRLAAEHCETLSEETPLQERLREAIRYVGRLGYPRAFSNQAPATSAAS
jgi:hypothetical protein